MKTEADFLTFVTKTISAHEPAVHDSKNIKTTQ